MRSATSFILAGIMQITSNGLHNTDNTKVEVLNFTQFESYLSKQNDTVYLVNFWATWCAPCREEMPVIKNVEEKYSQKKFRLILVSLDLPGNLKNQLIPYILKNNIKSKVILLDDPDQNKWIDAVDPGWSGEIPFTVLYGKDFRKFYPHPLQTRELDSILNQKLGSP